MSNDPKPGPPDAIEDVRRGLGLLFRAAKTAVQKLPTDKIEDAVLTGAKEVGRALENVGRTLEKEIMKKREGDKATADNATPNQGEAKPEAAAGGADEAPKEPPPKAS